LEGIDVLARFGIGLSYRQLRFKPVPDLLNLAAECLPASADRCEYSVNAYIACSGSRRTLNR
jgi:hypothetical protein